VQNKPRPSRSPLFVPRFTLFIGGGFVLFVLLSMLYALPVMLEEPPPGASPDYVKERVRAYLEGKTGWIMIGSFVIVAAAGSRWMKN
jgi:hypothetical protein